MSKTVDATIAVLTYRRPADLGVLLPMLNAQIDELASADLEQRFDVSVLVVDNDADGSGAAEVRILDLPRTRVVVESSAGIAAARNRALDESSDTDLLIFIDDDERPQALWLQSLLQTWAQFEPTAVAGRIVPEYDGDLDPWLAAGEFFIRFSRPTGTQVDHVAAGNLLLDLHQVRRLGVRFDARFGLSGGEDSLFSREIIARGGSIVWCDESVAVDRVPLDRMTRRWVLTRRCSHGNSAALIDLHLADDGRARMRTRLRTVAKGAVRAFGGAGRYLVGRALRSNRHQALGLRAAAHGAGMLSGAVGLSYQEYSRTGRRWVRA